ncbi:putative squalene monooxygenase [Metarhizium anisopliae BRIP 53293]|uniref:Squalene monooxygenase n=1 Tax=Metarhizium anisopliae BRIP 53293 TaxID=1291518 RepID=A0A0D9NM78_METAN|nr:putative squalene monooxygenase [Metarhizium anisopliae BRIP 53293]KJK85624.1 putative squalene monooxygenase [Metarhizium anisopliae BRIP 53284]
MAVAQPKVADSRRENHRHADVIVVGAGIFGAAIAITLARQNRSVFLLERSLKEPDRIVGELLQPGGVQALETLGLGTCLHGIDSIPVRGYEVFYHGQAVTIPYPIETSSTSTPLPERPQGRSFHHGRFVRALRECAAREANITLVETLVTGLVTAENADQVLGVKSLTKERPDYFFAPLSIIADGYKSKFRAKASRKAESRSKFWALELQDAVLPSPGFGHVLLGSFSPVLLYQIGTRETRALINVPEGLEDAKSANGGVLNYIKHRVLPNLPASVQPTFAISLEKGRLRCMPNSFLPAAPNRTPGLIIAGDALNMRHPLTGGGMTVALNDVILLSELLDPSRTPDFENTAQVLQQLTVFHWRRKRHTFVINILAQALYSLFAADDYYLEVLRQGCFEYFKRGGNCVDGPAGLLGGIIRKPLTLVYHFFAVAFFSIWILFLSRPVWKLPITIVESVMVLLKACWVLLPYIAFELTG